MSQWLPGDVTWMDIAAVLAVLIVSGWLMIVTMYFREKRRRKMLEKPLDIEKIRQLIRKM